MLVFVTAPRSTFILAQEEPKGEKKPAAAQKKEKQSGRYRSIASRVKEYADEDAVVLVNGEAITKAELVAQCEYVYDRSMYVYRDRPPKNPILKQWIREESDKQGIIQLINGMIIGQAKAAGGVKITEKVISDNIDKVKKGLEGLGATLEQYLARKGQTMADLRQEIVDTVETQRLLEERFGPLKPTDEQIDKYYEENQDALKTPPELRTSHIFFGFSGAAKNPPEEPTPEERVGLRTKAEQALERVKAGENFAELAEDLSTDPYASQGGDRGYHRRGELDPAYERIAWPIEPGEVSDPVETKAGFHILKVTGKREAVLIPLEEMKEDLGRRITSENFQQRIREWLGLLRQEAEIEVLYEPKEEETTTEED